MNAYQGLAGAYDSLTGDVAYEKRADYLEKLFARSRIPVHTVLDLACGTGTMTWLLTGRGYELIAVDASVDMLMQAREKSAFQADVQVTRGDRLLILSTCAYSYETERLLVVAKIIE